VGLERIVADLVDRVERRFYGKYRGVVVDNQDPSRLGRLRVRVPSVLGPDVVTGWATACVPSGGAPGEGFLFIPPRDAGVWVEFEEGDLEFPIWVGTFWSKPAAGSELPKPNGADGAEAGDVQDPPTCRILKTGKGHTLQFEEGGQDAAVTVVDGVNKHVIRLDAKGVSVMDGVHGHRVVLDDSGVAITTGKNADNAVRMTSSGVTIKDGNGNTVELGSGGIKIGGGATQPLVLGQSLDQAVQTFVLTLNTHTHVGNLGAPTSPPVAPMSLSVPLSTKHKVE